MEVEFRLLGDVQARIDGSAVDIGHARQRCVLVALLVDANRLVPIDVLLDRVWSERLPQRARNTLSGYVSRLRRVLVATNDVAITRHPGGYVLTVDPMAVDLHRFHHLSARARAARDEDDALTLFEQALGLWGPTAFATLDTPWLDSVRVTLDAQRLAAELDRNDLLLGRGQHAALLDDLSERATEYPLNERVAGQLMLALYRCGRQADALYRYEHVRSELAEALGADPSPPLQRLHRQILAADPALATTTASTTRPAAAARGSPVPRQLPAPPRGFTGRDRELAALDALARTVDEMAPAVVISTVSGCAGVGKTALAVHWAHRVAQTFTDGQLYVNLRGFDPRGSVTSLAEAMRGFLDALDVPRDRIPSTLDAQSGLYRSLLTGRRMLIVLDNARDAEQVRPLLPGSAGCMVVVTSRNELTGLLADGAEPLVLDLLTGQEARTLLIRRLGRRRVAAEPAAVTQTIDRCARLPLTLSIVAARAAARPAFPLAVLASELAGTRGALDAFASDDAAIDVRAVFSWSYNVLSAEAARVFRLMALNPGADLAAPAAASLAGIPPARARSLLAELTRAHLVTEPVPGRFSFHDLLRAYARELTDERDPIPDRHSASSRVLDHYLHAAHAAALHLHPQRDPIVLNRPRPGVAVVELADHGTALAWFRAERAVLLAAVPLAAEAGFDSHAWQLSWALMDYLDYQGHWHEQRAVQRTAAEAARRLADLSGQAHAHRGLARAYARLNLDQQAYTHFERALDLYGAAGDRTGQARTHLSLGLINEQLGRIQDVVPHTQQALVLFRAAGHLTGQANALNNLGWHHAQRGDHRQAIGYCEQALAVLRDVGDPYGEAGTWHTLGYARHQLGHHPQAIDCYERAICLLEQVGERHHLAEALTHLGDTHLAAGRPGAARQAWQRAIVLLDELGHADAEHLRARVDQLAADACPVRSRLADGEGHGTELGRPA
jgi:DNA-binding SARP family transcriptional activator/tetratricopeptide (TPR) repeat protein